MNKISTGLLDALLTTGGIKETLDDSEFRIYTGIEPESADDSIGSATLLTTIKNGASGITFSTATPGVLTKPVAETWQGTNAASGTATWYRLVKADDTGAASTSAVRMQGTVGVIGADLNLASTALVSGAPQAIDNYVVTVLAS